MSKWISKYRTEYLKDSPFGNDLKKVGMRNNNGGLLIQNNLGGMQ